MPPWVTRPTLEIDLSLPLARRFDTVPRAAFSDARKLLTAVMRDLPPSARMLAYAVQLRTGNRFHREAAALAHLAGVDWRDVILANISYDLVLASLGCSTVALPTPTGPVLARNMDWWPEEILAQSSYLIRCGKRGELSFAHAGWPAAIGVVSGMSGRGFGVVLNAVSSPEGIDRTGYPVLLHLRRVLEDAVDFDQALMMLSNQRLCAGALFTLVGVKNEQRVVIERTCRKSALRWPREGEPLVATNDYRMMPKGKSAGNLHETACGRYDALCRHFGEHRSNTEVSDSRLLYALSDPQVIQGITAQHVVIRPRMRQIGLWVPRRLVEVLPVEPAAS